MSCFHLIVAGLFIGFYSFSMFIFLLLKFWYGIQILRRRFYGTLEMLECSVVCTADTMGSDEIGCARRTEPEDIKRFLRNSQEIRHC